tara:strand:- start:3174 stop:3341 length:168 start_codon:yes stop_codon:yes gene_type:complete
MKFEAMEIAHGRLPCSGDSAEDLIALNAFVLTYSDGRGVDERDASGLSKTLCFKE